MEKENDERMWLRAWYQRLLNWIKPQWKLRKTTPSSARRGLPLPTLPTATIPSARAPTCWPEACLPCSLRWLPISIAELTKLSEARTTSLPSSTVSPEVSLSVSSLFFFNNIVPGFPLLFDFDEDSMYKQSLQVVFFFSFLLLLL